MRPGRTIFILSASSDIGRAIMRDYLAEGHTVVGTSRDIARLSEFADHPRAVLLPLDLDDPRAAAGAAAELEAKGLAWQVFIACNGTMEPIGPFMELDGSAWAGSINSNAVSPCLTLQHLYPHRARGEECAAVFMAGGGTNNPFTNYSAYCLSKILLIKMCELLDDEVPDLKTFIVGPGYVRTKIHKETLRAGGNAGANLEKTKAFLEGAGTSMADIKACIDWGLAQRRDVIGGRNLSVVHDPWQMNGQFLADQLASDRNRFKLRRFGSGLFSSATTGKSRQ